MIGRAMRTSSQLRSVSAPISQVTICDVANGVGARLIASAVIDPATLDRITPASVKTMRLPERPTSRASSAIAPAAPVRAKAGSSHAAAVKPKNSDRTAPSAAPADTPKRPGSASGLRK